MFSLEVARRAVPADGRVDPADGRRLIPFGPVVQVADGAGPYELLAGYLGRPVQ